MDGSITILRVFGIPIRVHYSWLIVFGLITWDLAFRYFPEAYPSLSPPAAIVTGILATVLLFSSILLHELSHSLVALRSHVPISSITLFIFGGVARMDEEPHGPGEELAIAAAGPLTSFVLSFVFHLIHLSDLSAFLWVKALSRYLAFVNLFLGLLNLLPGFPLDGGRIVRAVLWYFFKDLRRATKYASRLGQGVALLFAVGGVWHLFLRHFLEGVWLLFLGWFLDQAARTGYRQILAREALGALKVRDIMTPLVDTIPADTSLDEAADRYFLPLRHKWLPVMDENLVTGLVALSDLRKVEKSLWSEKKIRDVMTPISRVVCAAPDESAYEILGRMAAWGVGLIPILSEGMVVGVVTRGDLSRVLQVRGD
ncbi:MAG: site-2 protease family protein [Armatimonadetes bacterium]|nr:site-2 protease family protein [Armatimonadota bacterium]